MCRRVKRVCITYMYVTSLAVHDGKYVQGRFDFMSTVLRTGFPFRIGLIVHQSLHNTAPDCCLYNPISSISCSLPSTFCYRRWFSNPLTFNETTWSSHILCCLTNTEWEQIQQKMLQRTASKHKKKQKRILTGATICYNKGILHQAFQHCIRRPLQT